MARSKTNDEQVFICEETHQLNYLTHLYNKNEEVEKFLRRSCATRTIDKKTHIEVFKLIEEELGYPIP